MPIPFFSPVSNSPESLIRLITATPHAKESEEDFAVNHLNDIGNLIIFVLCSIFTIGIGGAAYKLALQLRGWDTKRAELKLLKEALQDAISGGIDAEESDDEDELCVESKWNGQKTTFYFKPSTDGEGVTVNIPQLKLTFTTYKTNYETLKQKFNTNRVLSSKYTQPLSSFSAPSTPTRTRGHSVTTENPYPYTPIPQQQSYYSPYVEEEEIHQNPYIITTY